MRVPIALAAITVVAAAVALLSGCDSGSGGGASSDKIQGVGSASAPPSTPATAFPAPTDSAGRPTITFPSYAKNVFEDQYTGDPAKDAVLADNERWVDSMDDAIFRGTASTKELAFYSTGRGTELAVAYVQGYIAKGDKWAGSTRFFARKVSLLGGDTASVVYCSDESQSHITNPKKPTKHTPTSPDSYVLYNTHLTLNAQGVWQTDNVVSDRGARQCRP
ncbi:hypothetical protein ACFO3J_21855 [Streptomyces polygonati]|uniref:Lipoprotein n=1 Tax=Streptomyces polygonati TaxID=1617087 RepID=A0ABV8HQ11_9ACTN